MIGGAFYYMPSEEDWQGKNDSLSLFLPVGYRIMQSNNNEKVDN
jgi:hypothetical protein